MDTLEKRCSKCREGAPAKAAFCSACGSKLEPMPGAAAAQVKPDKTLFGVMAPAAPAEEKRIQTTPGAGPSVDGVVRAESQAYEATEKNDAPPAGMPLEDEFDFPYTSDPLAKVASKIPKGQPGTLFGFQLAKLRDASLRRKALFVSGILLLLSIVVPLTLAPLFRWDVGLNGTLIVWPVLVGLVYLFTVKAPHHLKLRVPAPVLRWAPFVLALLSVGIAGFGAAFAMGGAGGLRAFSSSSAMLLQWGYPIVILGLLFKLSDPSDSRARYVIGTGAVLCLPATLTYALNDMFSFSAGWLYGLHNVLYGLVLLIAVLSFMLVPTETQVPKLRSAKAFAPLMAAILLAWVPLQIVLTTLAGIVHTSQGLSAFTLAFHMAVASLAYLGVLLLSAPEAYDEAKRYFAEKRRNSASATP